MRIKQILFHEREYIWWHDIFSFNFGGKGKFLEDAEQDERGFWTRGAENCEEGTEGGAAVHAGGAAHHAVHAQEAIRRRAVQGVSGSDGNNQKLSEAIRL